MANPDCKKSAKKNIDAVLCKAIQAGGEPAYLAYRDAHNAFINTLSTTAQATLAVVEPILTIDKMVYETFVKPPLDAAIQVLDTTQKTIQIPMRMFVAMNGKPPCHRFGKNINQTTNELCGVMTKGITEAHNYVDEMDEWIGDRTALIEALQGLVDDISSFEIVDDYETFLKSGRCQTT